MATLKKKILVTVVSFILFGLWLWCTLAIRFSSLPGEVLPPAVAGIFAAGVPLAFIFLPDRKRTAYGVFILCAGIIVAWLQSHNPKRMKETTVTRIFFFKVAIRNFI